MTGRPFGQALIPGLQHTFGMSGMFVFPGLLGRSFNLPADRIAYLYGMTFVVCGFITVLQSVWLLRIPVVQGTCVGNFAALPAVGQMQSGGLGAVSRSPRFSLDSASIQPRFKKIRSWYAASSV